MSTVVERAAWEVEEDGTVWPVTVLSGRSMFGHYKVRRRDGSEGLVYQVNLRAEDNIDVRFV